MESIFVVPSARSRHEDAPLWPERQQYLLHLLRLGTNHENVRSTASILLQVVRLLHLSRMRTVDWSEIEEAGERWARDNDSHLTRKAGKRSAYVFSSKARCWFRFHGQFTKGPPPPFSSLIDEFRRELRDGRGLSPETVHGYTDRSQRFLNWLPRDIESISSVTLRHLDEYFDAKRAAGWQAATIKASCQALRSLFNYAELRGWCVSGFASGIRSPRIPKYQSLPRGPSWRDVRRLIRSTSGNDPADMKARAIILLCSVYALRNSEVCRLRLEDIDWRKETMTIRRCKGSRIQQFPLQFEVGEAILRYLQVRPRCTCRNVFVTERLPRHPLLKTTLGQIVTKRMKQLDIEVEHFVTTWTSSCLRYPAIEDGVFPARHCRLPRPWRYQIGQHLRQA
jgi:site-specific recombinase XerD